MAGGDFRQAKASAGCAIFWSTFFSTWRREVLEEATEPLEGVHGSTVIDNRYNPGNARVLVGRGPTGTLALPIPLKK